MSPAPAVLSRRELLRGLLSVPLAASCRPVAAASWHPSGPTALRHPPAAATPPSATFARLAAQIRSSLAAGKSTGLSVAVVQQGRVVWQEGFGWANRAARIPVTARTPFSLASLTKPFTTTLAATLVPEKKLSLDDPAIRYLPAPFLQGPNGDPGAATLLELGAHAAGLPLLFEQLFPPSTALTPSAFLQQFGQLAYPPGATCEYSNIGYAALGIICSRLTGTPFPTALARRVLAPLALHDTFFDTDLARLRTAALRYNDSGEPIPFYTTPTPASGELYSSALDLARFALFHLGHLSPPPSTLLSRVDPARLHAPVFRGANGISSTFGWFSSHLPSGTPVLYKNGGQPGVATLLYLVPSTDLACVFLGNQSGAHDLIHDLCQEVITAFLGEWTPADENPNPAPAPFHPTPELAGLWRGTLTAPSLSLPIALTLPSASSAAAPAASTLTLGSVPPEPLLDLRREGTALTARTHGRIPSPEILRQHAETLRLRLLPSAGRLVGRVIAEAGPSGSLPNVMLPTTLRLQRP